MFLFRCIILAITAFLLSQQTFANENNAHQNKAPIVKPEKTLSSTVNINKAGLDELLKVNGMTLSKAKSIIAYRKQQGDFKSLDALSQVKGFKRMKKEKRELLYQQLTI